MCAGGPTAAYSAFVIRAKYRLRVALSVRAFHRAAMKARFRMLIAIALLLHALGFFVLPLVPGIFSPETIELMRYGGHGARVNPTHPIVYWFYLLPFPALIAMYFFLSWGRYLFLAFLLTTSLGTFVLGVSVAGPPETFLGYVGTLADGAIAALAFLSPIKDNFLKSTNAA